MVLKNEFYSINLINSINLVLILDSSKLIRLLKVLLNLKDEGQRILEAS